MAFNKDFHVNFTNPINSVTNDELDEILSLTNVPISKQDSNEQENLFEFNRERLSISENMTPNIESHQFEQDESFDSLSSCINLSLSFLKTPEKDKDTAMFVEDTIPTIIDLSTSKKNINSNSSSQSSDITLDPILKNLKAEFESITQNIFETTDDFGIFDEFDEELSIPLPSFLQTAHKSENPLSFAAANSQNVKELSGSNTSEPSSSQISIKFGNGPLSISTIDLELNLPSTSGNSNIDIKMEDKEETTIISQQFQQQESKRNVSNNCRDSVTTLPPDVSMIPKSVSRLFDTVTNSFSDFAFVYALSAQMCQEIMPMDCFVNLKMGLLLSIASIEIDSSRPPICIVGIGEDNISADIIMNEIGNVARRFVSPLENHYTGPTTSEFMIEAGALSLAKGGVCYLGNWSRIKPSQAEKIFIQLESGRIQNSKSMQKCQIECAVWCYWSSYKYNVKDQHIFNKFLEVFGIPFIIDEEEMESFVDFTLEQSTVNSFEKSIDELSISQNDMRSFLDVISRRRVDMTSDALDIIENYFIALRNDRPDCITNQAIFTLKRIAESFAKLSCRHEVIIIDAIAAIYLSETFIYNLFGPGANPPPKFTSHNYIGDVDVFMGQFQQWLSDYLEKSCDNPQMNLSLANI